MKNILLIFFLIFGYNSIKAAVFTVTSKDDSGSGTLREAIGLANSNGFIQRDYIYFNLSGSSVADVTIALESELPKLTSNIVIDATTQPFAVLGNPNIRVILIRVVTDFFSGLRLDHAQDIEIYGLSFSNFKSDPAGEVDQKKAGIFLLDSRNIIIGAPNKPNCFNNNYAGILSPYVIPRADNVNIKISSNIIGLGENGLSRQPNEVGIDLSFLKNSVIGGLSPAEGNLISANLLKGIDLGGADGNISVSNNIIGLDQTLQKTIPSIGATGVIVNGQSSIPVISDNTVCAQLIGIEIIGVNGGFRIIHNKVGTSVTGNENFGNVTGIHVRDCNKGVIGGDFIADENKISYNKLGVLIDIAYPISMLKNSFYCNTEAIAYQDLPAGKTVTTSKITTINATQVSGVYLPNAKIELFYTDSCPDCQGKTWFATLLTDGSGNWNYNGPVSGKITSMGTNADGATAIFSKPQLINESAVITGVVCGEATGSIALTVYDASVFQWYDLNNQLVGTNRILTGVGSGTYYLKAGQLGSCDVRSALFTIDASSNGINDLQQVIIDTYCGNAKGSIKNISVANQLSRTWFNAAGELVSTEDDLIDAVAGIYYFKVGTGSCEVVSKRYTIKNVIFTYQVNNLKILPATCGQPNGSINLIGYDGVKPDRFEWKDAQGNVVGNTENLQNLKPGQYTLTAYGNQGCSNIVGSYNVSASPAPVLDYSNLQQSLSCDSKSVAAVGIKINGTAPFRYEWRNEAQAIVSTQLNLIGAPLGKYILTVHDANNCTALSKMLDFAALPDGPLTIPNTFTPNGDGVNDEWQIKGLQYYPLAVYSVYNRNGVRVFYSRGDGRRFDGTFNRKLLSTGVYYYVIDLKSKCDPLTGSLTIVR